MNNAQRRFAGFSLISASLITALVLAYGAIILSVALSSRSSAKSLSSTVLANQLAEAGLRKAVFCLNATDGDKCGGTYGVNYAGETDVSIEDGTFSTNISGTGPTRTLIATGRTGQGYVRRVTAELTSIPPTDNMEFSYALQAGQAGATLENNSSITGTLYSGGSISCSSTNAIIDGDAYVSLAGGSISACRVKYHAHADRILNSRVDRNAYYRNNPADISGTIVSGTKYSGQTTPVNRALPPINLTFWHDSAEAGGTVNGNYYPADNSTLGPKKINGDLIFNNNVDVTITGPVWVIGDIIFNNNVSLTLHSSFGAYSTVLLADHTSDQSNHGKITLYNNTEIYGSGNPTSHILLAATNSSIDSANPALLVNNNAAGAVFLAPNGMLRLTNNAGAKSLAAHKIYLDNNAVVTYLESELADMQFSNSPSSTWRVKEGSWREAP